MGVLMVIQESVNVEPSTRAAGIALAKMIGEARKGANPLAVILALIPDLIPLISAIPKIPEEIKDDPQAEVVTAVLIGVDIYKALTS